MYAIDGPITLWSGLIIRNQTRRPNVKAGIPVNLYYTKQAVNWGVQLFEEEYSLDQRLLRDMLDSLHGIDIKRLLLQATEDWCKSTA